MTVSHEFKSHASSSSLAANAVLQARYRVVRQLGRGGMGAVYEAVDERLGITVALKETFSSEAPMRKQFAHEARLLASMQHPALPRVSDHFVEGDRAFLVMQFIGGVDLARIIAQQPGPFPRDQVIVWADQLLDALIYLHSRDRQVIHRDIKPHNLKLTATGQIALLDFGLARIQPADQSLTASRAFYGYTKHYAPLEQIQDQRTDPRSDIYALGATLYHLLTGIKPPDAMVRATALINSDPDPLKSADQIHPAVGPQIAAILSKAMAQRSEDRFANAAEFREALRRMGRTRQDEFKVRSPFRLKSGEPQANPEANDPTVMKMAMVASARRFGPGAMTAVLITVATLALGLWYGSQQWFKSSNRLQMPAAANSTVSDRQNAAIRKTEKSRTVESIAVLPVKTRDQGEPNKAEKPIKEEPLRKDENVEKKSAITTYSPPDAAPSNFRPSVRPRENRPRPNAPSIRLPKPEVADAYRLTSVNSGIRNYGSSNARNYGSSNTTPRFYRAANGTQIVKFPDGSSRVIRPGERSGR
ncbi:MAG: protein kinase [Acidobacteriota bacterium]